MIRKSLTATFCVAALFAQSGSAFALARTGQANTTIKKKVVSNITVIGSTVDCGPGNTLKSFHNNKWGSMEISIQVTKTVTTVNGKPSVAIKINKITWPVSPTHTSRSIYINATALPLLRDQVLQLKSTDLKKLITISGATHTTISFRASLQAAILKAETP